MTLSLIRTLVIAILSGLILANSTEAAAVTQTAHFRLTWTDMSDNETGFNVYRCLGATCTDDVKVGSTVTNVAVYDDYIAGDSGNLTYSYYVTAYNTAGESGPSNVVAGTTPAIVVIPNAPTGIIATMVGVTIP